jgi:uncharacterized membrane protein
MKPKHFLDQLDEARVLTAIAAAEQESSGEIRIYVSGERVVDSLAAAQIQFARLGMEKTQHRNAVLLFFAPKSQQFAIVGDTAIHEKCGPDYWRQISDEMTVLLKNGRFTEAVVEAITRMGDVLASHFPRTQGDRNELTDEIAGD